MNTSTTSTTRPIQSIPAALADMVEAAKRVPHYHVW